MRSVALIGADGAGKSTIARELVGSLRVPSRYLYMGTNPDSTTRMLPTTRLARAITRSRRGPSERARSGAISTAPDHVRQSPVRDAYRAARTLAWLAEEWYRAATALAWTRLGFVVVFDRHFLYESWPGDGGATRGASRLERARRQFLRRFYPRPDLVICLDAPAELLHERKREQSVETLERVRREYLALADVGPEFVVVDAAQPLASVLAEVRAVVEARLS